VLDGLKALIVELWPRKGKRAVEQFETEAMRSSMRIPSQRGTGIPVAAYH
jgi:hypothetical protein